MKYFKMSRLLICTLVLSLAIPKIALAEEATDMTTVDEQYEYVEESFEEVMSTLEEDITYEEGSI